MATKICPKTGLSKVYWVASSLAAALVADLPVVALVGRVALRGHLDPAAAAVAAGHGAGRAGAHHGGLLACCRI